MTQPANRRLVTEDRFLVTEAEAAAAYDAVNSIASLSPNYIINGAFDFWQRGTSFSSIASNEFSADRWQIIYNGTGATRNVTQQVFSPGTAPVAGNGGQYFWRMAQTVAGTGGTYNVLSQRVEDVRTLAGQTVTYSFWAKADTARSVSLEMFQNFGTGGSSSVYASIGTVSLTTSWARYSLTYNVPSITGKTIGANSNLQFQIALPLNVVQTIDIWGVQLEVGSVATAFRRNANSIQGELAACQRYYYRINSADSSTNFAVLGHGRATTTQAVIYITFPTEMRVAPTSIESSASGTWRLLQNNSTYNGTSVITGAQFNTNGTNLLMSATGQTTGAYTQVEAANTKTAYVGISAEL